MIPWQAWVRPPLLLCNSEENFVSSVAPHSFIPSIREAGASGSLSSRSVWSTQLVPGPLGPRNETLGRGERSPVMKSKIAHGLQTLTVC